MNNSINASAHEGHQAAILNGAGVPVEILMIERATALDALVFITSLLNRIGLEPMAQKEGRTFNHPLAGGIGAMPVGAVSESPKDQG